MNVKLALHVVEIEAYGITRQSAEQRKNDNAAFRKRRIRFPHARMSSTLGRHGESISIEPISVITGSSRGIGRALAAHYLELGHQVIGLSRGPCQIPHDDYRHFEVDITDERALRAVFFEIGRHYGAITNLINNAGFRLSITHC